MKKIILLILLLFNCFLSNAQIIYGVNNYTEYHPGNLPIILSVPHDGSLTPAAIPDRTCGTPTLVGDPYTYELAQQIDSALFALTGCHPHVIYCNLKRTKLDCNRNISNGACGNSDAETAWTEFHHFIDTAQSIAQSQYAGKAFYIDLHAHGHTLQQLELGYLYTSAELSYSDSVLNTPSYISLGSIQNLVATNMNGYSNSQMLRGSFAFGTLLGNAGYPSVPSLQIPSPGTDPYFTGGYNIENHTSYASGNTVNGVQIETNYTNVRDTYLNRKKFGDSLATILNFYFNTHLNINITNCGLSTSVQEVIEDNSIIVAPNPAADLIRISFRNEQTHFEVEIINMLEKIILKSNNQNEISISELTKGMYFIKVTDFHKNEVINKIIIQ